MSLMLKYILVLPHGFLNADALFKFLFNTNECFDSVDHLLHQFDFCEANALLVGNVPLATGASRRVFTGATARLHAESLREVFQLVWREVI